MKHIKNFKANIQRLGLNRNFSTRQEILESAIKYKDPFLIVSSLVGGLGIFGGMIAYVVGDRVNLKSQLEVLEYKLLSEKEIQAKNIKILENKLLSEKELLENKLLSEKELRVTAVELVKAQAESQTLQRYLNFKYHGDYENFRSEETKNTPKPPKNLP